MLTLVGRLGGTQLALLLPSKLDTSYVLHSRRLVILLHPPVFKKIGKHYRTYGQLALILANVHHTTSTLTSFFLSRMSVNVGLGDLHCVGS